MVLKATFFSVSVQIHSWWNSNIFSYDLIFNDGDPRLSEVVEHKMLKTWFSAHSHYICQIDVKSFQNLTSTIFYVGEGSFAAKCLKHVENVVGTSLNPFLNFVGILRIEVEKMSIG